jgi:hypothetical protein
MHPGLTGGVLHLFRNARPAVDAAHWADGGQSDNAKRGYREGHFSTLPFDALSGLRARREPQVLLELNARTLRADHP